MGQAKRRGTFEQRKAQALARKEIQPIEKVEAETREVKLEYKRPRYNPRANMLALSLLAMSCCGLNNRS